MPYSGPADPKLPPSVRKLPKALREVWLRVFNEHYDSANEAEAFKMAWGAVRKIQSAKEARIVERQDMDDIRVWLMGEKAKTEDGVRFERDAYLYVPDEEKPSSWRVRVEETPGSITRASLAAAASLLGPAYSRQRTEMSASDRRKCAHSLIDRYRTLAVADADIPDYLFAIAGQVPHGSASVRLPFTFEVKEIAGKTRWAMISSGAFEDRDEQIVSKAFLESALAFANATDFRGTLNIWHVKNSDVGPCDYQALVGDPPLLFETGTFDDTPAGRAAAKHCQAHASELGGSIEFYAAGLTEDGVFLPPGVILRRSFLPLKWAAFPWSGITVKESIMTERRQELVAEFARIFEKSPEEADKMVSALEAETQTLKDWNIRWKEVDATPAETTPAPTEVAPEAAAVVSEPAPAAVEAVEAPAEPAPADLEVVISPDAMKTIVSEAVSAIKTEIAATLDALNQRLEAVVSTLTTMGEQQIAATAVTKELQETVGKLQRTDDAKIKDVVRNLPRATVKALQPPAVRPTQRTEEPASVETESMLERARKTLYG